MLEAYQAYGDYTSIAALTQKLIQNAALAVAGSHVVTWADGTEFDLGGEWDRISMYHSLSAAAGVEITPQTSVAELKKLAETDPNLDINGEVERLGTQLKSASEKLEKDAPTLSDSQRGARQRQLVELDREFQRKRREFQEDLAQRKNEELQLVLERANRVIKQVAESEKYDLIMQEAVYVNPKLDITDKVLSGLNNAK